ncbi:MAG TPA: FG-GAP-like repeat-containing protein, partial [Fimbriiglobus sp.]
RDPRGVAALGANGGQLGYGAANPITPSFALAINMYTGHALGTEFLTNGNIDFNYTESAINTSANNSPITVTMTYAAGFLTVTLTQGSATETKTLAIDLPALLGGPTAIVGFTGATGGASSTQEITDWTFDQGTPPAAPTNVQATITGYTAGSTSSVPMVAHLTWTTAAGASGYKIERKVTAGGTYAPIGTSTGPTFDDSGLAPGTNYFYRVQATNAVGDGPYSPEIPATTPNLAPTPTGSGTDAVTPSSVALHWTDNAGNEDGFQIFRSVNQGTFSLLVSLPPDTAPAPSTDTYTDTGLTAGTRYDYHIQAYNLAGYSDFAGVSTATRTTAPTNLTALAQSGQISLAWSAPTGADTYSVYRSTTPGGEGATPLAAGITGPTYVDTSVVFGTTYYYVVTASDLGGESARSAEAFATAFGPTATVLAADVNPTTEGRTVTLTATVSAASGTPTGTVDFLDGPTILGSAPVTAFGGLQQASFTIDTLTVGTHAITAQYDGATGFSASVSPPINEVVNPNTPPTISPVADQAVLRGGTTGALAFNVGDAETPAANLAMTFFTSNSTVVPVAGVVLGGSGPDRTVTVTPAAGALGFADITLTVTDVGGLQASTTFRVTVTPATPPGLVGYRQFAVGAGSGGSSTVNFYNADGTLRYAVTPFPGFTGGIRTAAGDVNGDGTADLIVGTGPGGPSHVIVYDGNSQAVLFTIDPFEASFTGGVFVATGDLDGDGKADVVISPDQGGGPRVRIFNGNGFGQTADFFGIDDPDFRGGARAAVGDLNGDGKGDLLVAAGYSGGPRVALYDGAQLGTTGGPKFVGDFFVFEQTLRNGVFITSGDLNGDGFADVIVGGGPGGGPRVFALSGKDLVQFGSHTQLANFFAGDVDNRGGIRVAAKDLDGDAKADLVVGAGDGAGSRVTGYFGSDVTTNGTPPEAFAFDTFPGFAGGVFVG